jgi:hypothetical protein
MSAEKNRLAAEALGGWADFQDGFSSDKRKYPSQQGKAFWAVTKRYAELTKSDPLIHKSLAGAVNRHGSTLRRFRRGTTLICQESDLNLDRNGILSLS